MPERTVRYWLEKYRRAEKEYGNGYVGFIPQKKNRGNQGRRLPQETAQLMQQYIENESETIKQKSKKIVYQMLSYECEEKGIAVPSYNTFCIEVNKRAVYEQTKHRKGRRAAYKNEPFYWELKTTTPRHGDRPFEICHIDHTELDIELVSSETRKNLGRPWVTFMVDAYSRRIVALYLTFDSPSHHHV